MGKKSSERFKKRRASLFKKQGGKCFWCGELMIVFEYKKGKTIPPNALTIDHLRDKLDPTRREHCHGDQRWVAACRKCNHQRGHERISALPIEEKWRRAGHLDRMRQS